MPGLSTEQRRAGIPDTIYATAQTSNGALLISGPAMILGVIATPGDRNFEVYDGPHDVGTSLKKVEYLCRSGVTQPFTDFPFYVSTGLAVKVTAGATGSLVIAYTQ